jgi:hypothetical protein
MADRKLELGIIARMNIPQASPSGRVYVHRAGLEAFGGWGPDRGTFLRLRDEAVVDDPLVEKALLYCSTINSRLYSTDRETWIDPNTGRHRFPFTINLAWGDKKKRMIDGIGFRDFPDGTTGDWPGNPGIYSWIVENGVLVSEPRLGLPGINEVTCGDGLIVASEEEKHRRKRSDSFADYVLNHPEIEGANLLFDVTQA